MSYTNSQAYDLEVKGPETTLYYFEFSLTWLTQNDSFKKLRPNLHFVNQLTMFAENRQSEFIFKVFDLTSLPYCWLVSVFI